MKFLNNMSACLKASETLAVKAKAAELSAQGKTIYDLSSGEPDIDTPEHIKDACIKALRDGHTKYKAVQGIIELRTALSEKFESDNSLAYSPAEIIITSGAKQALFNLFMVTMNAGDEVIIPAPYWVSFPSIVEIAGGKPVLVNCSAENKFKITPEQLENAIGPRTKAFILNNPNNPTGTGYTESELQALAAVLEKHPQVLTVSDEMYEKIVFGDFRFNSFAKVAPQLKGRIVTVGAFSKTYSMTGLRVGYAAGPKDIIAAMTNLQGQSASNVTSICQYGAVAALKGPQDFIKGMNASFERRMEVAIANIIKAPGVTIPVRPVGAYFLFIDYSKSEKFGSTDSTSIVNHILEHSGAACVQGVAFGNDRAFRVSVSLTDDTVNKGTLGIAAALA